MRFPADYADDPERVRGRIAVGQARWSAGDAADGELRPGDWVVFETFAADGTLAIGVARGEPTPGGPMVVYRGLSEALARIAAAGLAAWHRRRGRVIGGSG